MTDDRHEKKFDLIKDGQGNIRKMGVKPHMPIYQPGDPRIEKDLARGAGVGVDLSKLSPEEANKEMVRIQSDLLRSSSGPRIPHDTLHRAHRENQPPLERFNPEDDEDE